MLTEDYKGFIVNSEKRVINAVATIIDEKLQKREAEHNAQIERLTKTIEKFMEDYPHQVG